MDILAQTRARNPDLADYLSDVMEAPFRFDGDDPNWHSAQNHIHLWKLEYVASDASWIDLGYRTRLDEALLARWRARLRGLRASGRDGFRLYLYQSMAPTISVVAETPTGFPYPPTPVFVDSPREIMALYVDRNWRAQFACAGDLPSEKAVLSVIEKNAGSIGKPTAEALGLKVGALRVLIEQFDLTEEVNAIRKRFKRRPARFRSPFEEPFVYRIYEERVPPGR